MGMDIPERHPDILSWVSDATETGVRNMQLSWVKFALTNSSG